MYPERDLGPTVTPVSVLETPRGGGGARGRGVRSVCLVFRTDTVVVPVRVVSHMCRQRFKITILQIYKIETTVFV